MIYHTIPNIYQHLSLTWPFRGTVWRWAQYWTSFWRLSSLLAPWVNTTETPRSTDGLVTTMWGPQESVQLVNITPLTIINYGSWYANNELVTGANLNQQTSLGGLTLLSSSIFFDHPQIGVAPGHFALTPRTAGANDRVFPGSPMIRK